MLAGVIDTAVTSPVSRPSTPVASDEIVNLPRPMNSDRTFSVSLVSRLNTVVRLVNSGIPIVLIEAGSVELRPASVYPQPALNTPPPRTPRTPRIPRVLLIQQSKP